jgi:phage tail sheath protein FI
LTYNVSREEHGELNRKGVNVIRMFPDGIRVWGARTLAAEASEWRYIPVRRTFNMIKESIQEGTRWTVFEPNDMMTWKSVERDIRAFLMRVWRDGALLGATPEQAFFVKCDAETNPPEVRDAGQLIAEIGIAPVKPAEFIVFRIGQWTSETESATSAGV